jgi:hypothetical protein
MSIEDLRKAAEAATPGPWVGFRDNGELVAIMPAGREGDVCAFDRSPSDEDGRFMLLANPAAILALYAERDAAIARAEKADERAHYATGTADLAMQHRDAAEAPLPAVTAERDALRGALGELRGKVFGAELGSEPNVYADHDELTALCRSTAEALKEPTNAE